MARWIAVVGHRYPAGAGSRGDVWRFRSSVGDVGENLTAEARSLRGRGLELRPAGGRGQRLHWSGDGRWIMFAAPIDGNYELWRVDGRDVGVPSG